MSIRAMASAIDISPTTLHKLLALDTTNDDGSIEVPMRRGSDGKIRPGRQIDTTYRDQQIRAKRDDKLTIREIAAAVGCSPGTVHRVLKRPPAEGDNRVGNTSDPQETTMLNHRSQR